jgi:hypothetical protein
VIEAMVDKAQKSVLAGMLQPQSDRCCAVIACRGKLYRFRLHRNDLTAEGAENAEGENTEMNNSDATGFDITDNQQGNQELLNQGIKR